MFTLRKRKLLYILLATCTVLFLLAIHSSLINHQQLSSNDWSLTSFGDKFDFSYLPNLSDSWKNTYNRWNLKSSNTEPLQASIIEPNNVQFNFIINNNNNKKTREEIIERNSQKYAKLMSTEVGKPQDASLVPPPEDKHIYNLSLIHI